MLARGVRSCLATSSGNTGSIAGGILRAIRDRMHGGCERERARGQTCADAGAWRSCIRVPGFVTSPEVTTRVYSVLERFSKKTTAPLVVSAYRYCRKGMEGVESLGRELRSIADLRHVFVPVGGGGLYSAVCRGLQGAGVHTHAAQPEGCLTVVASWLSGSERTRRSKARRGSAGLQSRSISMLLSRSNSCGKAAAKDTLYRTTTFSKLKA